MNKFYDLLEKSVLTSGLVAVMLVGTACYCTIAQVPLPQYLGLALGAVIGYFFSQKASTALARRVL